MEERRKLKRRYMLAEVRIKTANSDHWIQAVIMNINRGGIGLYAMEPVKKKDKLTIKITYLERTRMKEVEELPGVVRWVQPIGQHYAAGISFEIHVNRKTFPILTQCLEFAKSNK